MRWKAVGTKVGILNENFKQRITELHRVAATSRTIKYGLE